MFAAARGSSDAARASGPAARADARATTAESERVRRILGATTKCLSRGVRAIAALNVRSRCRGRSYAVSGTRGWQRERLRATVRLRLPMATPPTNPNPSRVVTADAGVLSVSGLSSAAERPGTVIGYYTLIEVIGSGGFGSVFLAEQSEPVARRVALKVLKLGMDTVQVIARFE